MKQQMLQFLRRAIHSVFVTIVALALTLALFLILPLMQIISAAPAERMVIQTIDAVDIPPPPPPPEEEPEDEPEEEPEPPELTEEAPPLDLSQLEFALNPGFSEGLLAGDFAMKLDTVTADSEQVDALFSLADLDQKPRVMYQPSPTITPQVRRAAPGTVNIIFIVDEKGRVQNPSVQSSTAPVFEGPALAAVKQWKFEPGKRNGQPVRFRMRVPITFPKE